METGKTRPVKEIKCNKENEEMKAEETRGTERKNEKEMKWRKRKLEEGEGKRKLQEEMKGNIWKGVREGKGKGKKHEVGKGNTRKERAKKRKKLGKK